MDHSTPTRTEQVFGGVPIAVDSAAKQVKQLEINAREFGVELFNLQDSRRGIVHIIGPELGITQPGKTIVCGDRHTSTHGAFGALAFGIGTTEVGHVLATQCLLQRRPKTFAINVLGKLPTGVTAKDLILAIIGKIGMSGGTGYVLEYRGAGHRSDVDGRAHDHLQHVHRSRRTRRHDRTRRHHLRIPGKATPRAPKGAEWDAAVARWSQLPTDAGAMFDRTVEHRCVDARADGYLRHASRHGGARCTASVPRSGDAVFEKALKYMGLKAGEPISERSGEQRVRRQLHQRPSLGPAQRRARAARSQARRRREDAGGAGLAEPSNARPKRKAWTRCSSPPAPSGARAAAPCVSA